MSTDPFDLERFVRQQALDYDQALAELRAGAKQTHWMWYTFPQLDGLGTSARAKRFAIRSLNEARAYLAHPVLGARLQECCEALLAVRGKTAAEILGSPDDLKLRSCATLFARVAPPDSVFARLVMRYFDGVGDPGTTRIMNTALTR